MIAKENWDLVLHKQQSNFHVIYCYNLIYCYICINYTKINFGITNGPVGWNARTEPETVEFNTVVNVSLMTEPNVVTTR